MKVDEGSVGFTVDVKTLWNIWQGIRKVVAKIRAKIIVAEIMERHKEETPKGE